MCIFYISQLYLTIWSNSEMPIPASFKVECTGSLKWCMNFNQIRRPVNLLDAKCYQSKLVIPFLLTFVLLWITLPLGDKWSLSDSDSDSDRNVSTSIKEKKAKNVRPSLEPLMLLAVFMWFCEKFSDSIYHGPWVKIRQQDRTYSSQLWKSHSVAE